MNLFADVPSQIWRNPLVTFITVLFVTVFWTTMFNLVQEKGMVYAEWSQAYLRCVGRG